MFVLSLAGPPVERALPTGKYLLVYWISGFIGWTAHFLLGGGGSGASSAVAGILGAVCVVSILKVDRLREAINPVSLSAMW